jgi:hypothetical protein
MVLTTIVDIVAQGANECKYLPQPLRPLQPLTLYRPYRIVSSRTHQAHGLTHRAYDLSYHCSTGHGPRATLSMQDKQHEVLLPSQWLLATVGRSRRSPSSTVGIPYSYISMRLNSHTTIYHQAYGHTTRASDLPYRCSTGHGPRSTLSTWNKQQETLLPSQWLLAAVERSRHSLSSTVGIPYSYIFIPAKKVGKGFRDLWGLGWRIIPAFFGQVLRGQNLTLYFHAVPLVSTK